MDAVSAFLQGELTEDIYMLHPEGDFGVTKGKSVNLIKPFMA